MLAQGRYQPLPVDLLGKAGGINDHGLVLEERPRIVHALVQRTKQLVQLVTMKNHTDGIQSGTFEVKRQRVLFGNRGRAHGYTQESRSVAVRFMTGRSGEESIRSATK